MTDQASVGFNQAGSIGMQMLVATGWRIGMKDSGRMGDLKSLFWTLGVV